MNPSALAQIATAIEASTGFTSTANNTVEGYWLRIALALESVAGFTTEANNNEEGYSHRAALAAEAIEGGSGAEENATMEGRIKRITDALELSVGVGIGSWPYRFALAAAGWAGGVARAALDLFFGDGTDTLDPRVTFTRTSQAMVTDATGKLTYAPNNLLLHSRDWSNPVWYDFNVSSAVGGQTAADGSQATKVTFADQYGNRKQTNPTILKAGTYIASFWVQHESGNTALTLLVEGATPAQNPITVSSVPQRVSARVTLSADAAVGEVTCGIQDRNVSGHGSVLVWDAQFEQVTYQTTPCRYYETLDAAYQGPRFDYDPADMSVEGPEQVSNGTFDTDTSGWIKGADAVNGTFAASGGVAVLTRGTTDGAYPRWGIPITGLTIGQTYRLRYDQEGATGTGDRAVVWTNDPNGTGGITYDQVIVASWTNNSREYTVTATATTMYLFAVQVNSGVGDTLGIDNVSVRQMFAQPLGILLEEARTNNLVQSAAFDSGWLQLDSSVSANTDTAPDGTLSVDTITAGTGAGLAHGGYQNFSYVAGPYTLSMYAKAGTYNYLTLDFTNGGSDGATFDLSDGSIGLTNTGVTSSIEPVGGGIYRCSITKTMPTVAGFPEYYFSSSRTANGRLWTPAGTETFKVWGAQLEAGAFATSYIPTGAATVTRSADQLKSAGTNFSDWYNQTEGTFLVELADKPAIGSYWLRGTSGGTDDIAIYNGPDPHAFVFDGVTSKDLALGLTGEGISKVAMAYKQDDIAAVLNGGTVVIAAGSQNLSTLSEATFGSRDASNQINGHIKRLRYYNTRLADETLVELTAPSVVPLIIFTGESNSGGVAPNASATSAELAPRPETFILNNTSLVFEPLDVGTNNLIGHIDLTNNTTHSWEVGLANQAEAGSWGGDVYMIKTGSGGSTVGAWTNKAASNYTTFSSRYDAAIAAIEAMGKIPAPIIWLSLGINDRLQATTTETFRNEMVKHVWQLREKTVICPVLLTEFMAAGGNSGYDANIQYVANNSIWAYSVNTDTADGQVLGDNNHWNYAGQKILADLMGTISRNPAQIGTGANYKANAGLNNGTVAKAGTVWGAKGSNMVHLGQKDYVGANSNFTSARSSTGKASGKHYIEYELFAPPGNAVFAGVCDNTTAAGAGLDVYNPTNCGVVRDDGFSAGVGFSVAGAGGLGTLAAGDIIGIAVDATGKKAWLSKNGTFLSSGNPAAGTSPYFTWSASYAEIFASLGWGAGGGMARIVPLGCTYVPPTGFSEWDA